MRMAIVSSFSDSCGNAAFTRVLRDSIEAHTDWSVEVIDLNPAVLQSVDGKARVAGNRHVDDICLKLKSYDAVNIQLEPGLYGIFPGDILARLKKLLSANPRTSATLHSPRLIGDKKYFRAAVKAFFRVRPKEVLRSLFNDYKFNAHIRLNRRLIAHIKTLGLRAIVHTGRAQWQIGTFYNYHNVVVHPLRIVAPDYQPRADVLAGLRQQLGLSDDDIVVGMFGYITPNKGHMDALAAMELLGPEVKLLICGRQHPQTIQAGGLRDEGTSGG